MDERLIRRQCLTCPSGVIGRHLHCHSCRQVRDRERKRVARLTDFTPAQIQARYLMAVWAKNPRKAMALARRAA